MTFQITDTTFYAPVVTSSTGIDKRFLEQLRTGSKRTIKWHKYRSEMTNQTKNNNLNYLINPAFTKVSIDFLSYRLKMKTIEHLCQSIIHQMFK